MLGFFLLFFFFLLLFCFVFFAAFFTHTQTLVSRGSDDEEGASVKGSKSFNGAFKFEEEEEDPQRRVSREKKNRTSKFIRRIFKRKSITPVPTKKYDGATSRKISHGDSLDSPDPVVSSNRGRCLTTSMSMPDITRE